MSQPPSPHDPGADGPRDDDATTAPDGPAGDDALWDTASGSEAPGEPDDVPTQQVPVTPPTPAAPQPPAHPTPAPGGWGQQGQPGQHPGAPYGYGYGYPPQGQPGGQQQWGYAPAPGTPGYGAPGQPGQPGYGYPGYAQPANGKATAALVVGISTMLMSWCCGAGVLGVVAIVLGVRARSEIQASGGRQTGDGLAITGIVTGAIAVVVGLAALALIVFGIVDSFSAGTSSGGVVEG